MHVSKRIDLVALGDELAAAGVAVAGLGHAGTDADGEVFTYAPDASGVPMAVDLPPEAAPVVDRHDASKHDRAAAFETAEDAERLAIIAERSASDPAFAALADLTLGKQGVQA